MTSVTINGNTYSDDGTAAKDLRNMGHAKHFAPMVSDVATVAGEVAANADQVASDAAQVAADKALAQGYANSASASASTATTQAGTATTKAAEAAASAAAALVLASQGLAQTTPAASKVPLADGAGKIDNGWLPASPTFTSVVATRNDSAQVANYRNTAAAYRTDIVIGNDAAASIGGLAGYGSASSGSWGSDRVNTVGLYANTGYGLSFVSGEHITINTNGFASANLRLKIDKTTGNLTPGVDNTQDFGTSALNWKDGRFKGTVYAGAVTASTYVKTGSYTVGTVPNAATCGAGAEIYVTNESGGATGAQSDGTSWRRYADRAVIS